MKSKFYIWIVKLLAPLVRFIFRLHYHGAENEPDASQGPYVMICNHISNADPVFLCATGTKQQPHFMAKKELFKVPLLNKLVSALGAYPVDRGGADVSAIRNSVQMLNEGKSIGIFPQGHRQKGITPKEATIKNGAAMIAAKANVQILPCCIRTKKNKFCFFRRVDVYFGKPIPFESFGYESGKTGEYARITQLAFDRVCALYELAEAEEKKRGK